MASVSTPNTLPIKDDERFSAIFDKSSGNNITVSNLDKKSGKPSKKISEKKTMKPAAAASNTTGSERLHQVSNSKGMQQSQSSPTLYLAPIVKKSNIILPTVQKKNK